MHKLLKKIPKKRKTYTRALKNAVVVNWYGRRFDHQRGTHRASTGRAGGAGLDG
jgi:RNA:NAD 2'-phosphotransferase (TPT1/KptA family)